MVLVRVINFTKKAPFLIFDLSSAKCMTSTPLRENKLQMKVCNFQQLQISLFINDIIPKFDSYFHLHVLTPHRKSRITKFSHKQTCEVTAKSLQAFK